MVDPVRVVVLDHTAALGGAEIALARLLDAVPREEFLVTTILFSDGPLVQLLREHGHRVEVLPLDPSIAGLDRGETASGQEAIKAALRSGPFLARLTARIARLRPDVIHTTSLKSDLLGMNVAKLTRTPLVWHIHDRVSSDYLPARTATVFRVLARRVPTEVIANSYATAETLEPIPHLSVAYPGFTPDQVGLAIGINVLPKPRVVGLLGRISPTKGQLEFVRAAAEVLTTHPGIEFRIIGSAMFGQDDYEQQVRAEIAARGLDDQVRLTGFVEDPLAAIDQLSLLVHASTTPEPFGQVIVEAMIRGVPVIATGAGGAREILDPMPDGELLGLLVPPSDVAALAQAITTVLDHPDDAAERAARAWRSAQERFPISRTVEVVSEVWRRAARAR